MGASLGTAVGAVVGEPVGDSVEIEDGVVMFEALLEFRVIFAWVRCPSTRKTTNTRRRSLVCPMP